MIMYVIFVHAFLKPEAGHLQEHLPICIWSAISPRLGTYAKLCAWEPLTTTVRVILDVTSMDPFHPASRTSRFDLIGAQ